MNLLMYIDFVAPLQFASLFNISLEEAEQLVLNNLSEEALNALTDDEKEYLGIPATGTLKNSVPNDQIDAALKLHEYKNAHDYKDEEFPKPLQKRRE